MSKRIFVAAIAAVVLCVSSVAFAEATAYWLFDSSGKTITDGEWSFAATINKNTTDKLTVGAVSADPGANSTLDFSKPVKDADDNAYVIHTLNPKFSDYENRTNLVSVVFPDSGLDTIEASAFYNCTALAGALEIPCVVTVKGKAFGYTAITSVTFGSNLKKLCGGWGSGCFTSCTSLTNVIFDAEMSGGTMDGEGIFAYCKALTGTIDLRGFTVLGHRPFYSYGGSIKKMKLSSSMTSAVNSLFNAMTALKEVEFDGGVPPGISYFTAALSNSSASLTDVYVFVPETYKDDWAAYCENDTIDAYSSYWDPEIVTIAKTKNIYLVYRSEGGGGEVGHWLYDADAATVTDGDWTFNVTASGKSLTVGTCTAYPADGGCLDFSASLTDADGGKFVFAHLDPQLYTGTKNNDAALASAAGLAIKELRFPTNHLASISDCAFVRIVNCTNIVNYLPDTVTTVGNRAFCYCPIVTDVKLRGVTSISGCAFKGASITSAEFGKDLASYGCGYQSGAISSCPNLTNIFLHAEMSGAKFSGEHAFYNNPKLGGTFDFTGFSLSSALGRPLDGTVVTNVIFRGTGDNLGAGVFEGMTKLQSIVFLGEPPTGADIMLGIDDNRSSRLGANQDVVTYIYKAYKDAWIPYAENGSIKLKKRDGCTSTTWKRDYIDTAVTDLQKRRLCLIDGTPDGLTLLVR